ncbi:MAG: dienelactone hydrolase family protein [Planctomycetia bacterium]
MTTTGIVLAGLAAILGAEPAGGAETKSVEWKSLLSKETYKAADGALPYRFLTPERPLAAGELYPLVIFLHGAGERGDDNEAQLVHGVKEFAKDSARKDFPCFLVAPQCPEGKKWVEVDWSAMTHVSPTEPSESEALLVALIDDLVKEHPIDPARLYVTGLSMGGYGTWDLICRYPERFAAAGVVCGGGDETAAPKAAKIPVWVFHGAKDGAVPVERSRNMIAALKKAGGSPKYTEYPEVGHNSWDAAYADPDFMSWLFAQKKPVKSE